MNIKNIPLVSAILLALNVTPINLINDVTTLRDALQPKSITHIYQNNSIYKQHLEKAEITQNDKDNPSATSNDNAVAYTIALKRPIDVIRGYNKFIGGYPELISALVDFDYESHVDKSAIYFGYLKIKIPENIFDTENLIAILNKYSLFYVWPDGSGTINLNNLSRVNFYIPPMQRKTA